MGQNLFIASVQGFNNDKVTVNHNVKGLERIPGKFGSYHDFIYLADGKRLTQLNIQAQCFSMDDVDKLIEFLQISRGCFLRPPETKPVNHQQ